MVFYLTTNADLQNFNTRINAVRQHLETPCIEIYALPGNLPGVHSKPPRCRDYSSFSKLGDGLAKAVGRSLKFNRMGVVQFHYPNNIHDDNRVGSDICDEANIESAIRFCRVMKEESGDIKWLSFNYHDLCPNRFQAVGETTAEKRESLHQEIKRVAELIRQINERYNSPCTLLSENNGIGANGSSEALADRRLKMTDLVPEDYLGRAETHGNTFDISHAWRVIECLHRGPNYENIRWVKEQYGGIPASAESMESFIEDVAPDTGWVHLADERYATRHEGLHIGDGVIDFESCARWLKEHIGGDTYVTIELHDSHTDAGFERIVNHDFPRLKKLLG
jgi:hypothetical protein